MNMIIGLGNCGTQVIRAAALSSLLSDVKMYAIDSVASNVDATLIDRIDYKSIVSDDKSGAGQSRERGSAMFQFHEANGEFAEMYAEAEKAKSPVLVVSSSAGGTGSGSIVPLCRTLMEKGVYVIPIIVCPNIKDPDAYHLNTNDLLLDLQDIGIETYSIFTNSRGDADYTIINNEIVSLIEIVFGHKYDSTELDSIDDSDLDVILNTPGRFMAISAEAQDVQSLQKEITRKVFTGYQPGWTSQEAENHTYITGYSLTSLFAKQDFKNVFSEVNNRIVNVYNEYRNICQRDNDGKCNATLIIAGLPRPQVKQISNEFLGAEGIGAGVTKSHRPSFLQKKKATITPSTTRTDKGDGSAIAKFSWK